MKQQRPSLRPWQLITMLMKGQLSLTMGLLLSINMYGISPPPLDGIPIDIMRASTWSLQTLLSAIGLILLSLSLCDLNRLFQSIKL